MKKISVILVIAMIICALSFAGCAKGEDADTAAESDTAETAEATESETAGETAGDVTEAPATEKTPDETFAPLEGLETVSVEFSMDDVGTKFNSKTYKFIKSKLFKNGDESLHWYEFFNACVEGEIDVTSVEARSYVESCFAFFTESELTDEAAQAKALLDATEERAN